MMSGECSLLTECPMVSKMFFSIVFFQQGAGHQKLMPEESQDFEVLCFSRKRAPSPPPRVCAVKADQQPPRPQKIMDGGLLQGSLAPNNHQVG